MGSLPRRCRRANLPHATLRAVKPPGQFGLEEVRMTCKTSLALSFLGSLWVVGCGGSGNGGGGTPPPASSTITPVSASCNPTSLPAGQTSQTSSCSASVQGTGSCFSIVTLSATDGAISTAAAAEARTTSTWPAPSWESTTNPEKQLDVRGLPDFCPRLLKTGHNRKMSRQLFMGDPL